MSLNTLANLNSRPSEQISLSRGWALLGLRFSGPASWFGAIILFFLPWLDIRCMDAGEIRRHLTISGAQLAWGGATLHKPDRKEVFPKQENFLKPEETVAQHMLTLYLIFLVMGVGLALANPGVGRATVGLIHSLSLLSVLLTGNWIFFAFDMEDGSRIFRMLNDGINPSSIIEYTPWYYASYAVNACAIFSFLLERVVTLDATYLSRIRGGADERT